MSELNTTDTSVATPVNGFIALGLTEKLAATLTRMGFTEPTPVQAATIPMQIQGHDLMASAPTGTGKTAAFLLPSLNRMAQQSSRRGPTVLVLVPTRELAEQVSSACGKYGAGIQGFRVACLTGGMPYRDQLYALSKNPDVIIATPGRLMDHMQSARLDWSNLQNLVLDEADRMLDMGFSDDVLHIVEALPEQRQTTFFTATLNPRIRQFAAQLLREPKTVELADRQMSESTIKHYVNYVDGLEHKQNLLRHYLSDANMGQAVVFTATKRDAEWLAGHLDDEGISTVALHGDLIQKQRNRKLDMLRRGKAQVLVATDVAARGIDVPNITHVFNFNLPRVAEDYVHRIGRTGRAGAEGTAISFVSRDDVMLLKRIERMLGQRVGVTQVEGQEARFDPSKSKSSSDRGGDNRGGPRREWGSRGGSSQGRGGDRYGAQDRAAGGRFNNERPAFQSDRAERAPFAGERAPYGERPAYNADRAPAFNRDRAPQERFAGAERGQGGARGDRFNQEPRAHGERAYGDRPSFGHRAEGQAYAGRGARFDGQRQEGGRGEGERSAYAGRDGGRFDGNRHEGRGFSGKPEGRRFDGPPGRDAPRFGDRAPRVDGNKANAGGGGGMFLGSIKEQGRKGDYAGGQGTPLTLHEIGQGHTGRGAPRERASQWNSNSTDRGHGHGSPRRDAAPRTDRKTFTARRRDV